MEYTIQACEHNGEPCDGARFCKVCRIQIFSGFLYGDEEYCNDHKPEGWDSEIAAMRQEDFDNQDEMYWTQWELEDIDCDCPTDCQCRPSPETLQALYDADRARSDAESKAINSWVGEVPQSKDGTTHWNVTHNPDGTVTATPEDIFPCSTCDEERPVSELIDQRCHPCIQENPEDKEMMSCELCGDTRLEEDLDEEQRCPPCAEREERNEEFDPDDGRCHDCGRVRPDWRSRTNCSICGVGLDWYCVGDHQCNTPQAAPREDLAEEE